MRPNNLRIEVGFDFARTYAYVNPVVAVLVGYFLGGEALGLRKILGTTLVLVSVVVITMTRAKKPMAALAVKARTEAVGS